MEVGYSSDSRSGDGESGGEGEGSVSRQIWN